VLVKDLAGMGKHPHVWKGPKLTDCKRRLKQRRDTVKKRPAGVVSKEQSVWENKELDNAQKFLEMADGCMEKGLDASANVYAQKASALIEKSKTPAPKPPSQEELKAAAAKKNADDKAFVRKKRKELQDLREKVKKYESKGNQSMAKYFKERVDRLEELIAKKTNSGILKKSSRQVTKVTKKGKMDSKQVLNNLNSLLGKMGSKTMRCAGNQGGSAGIRFVRKMASSVKAAGGVQSMLMGSSWSPSSKTEDEKFKRLDGFSKHDFSMWFPAAATNADNIPAAAWDALELLNNEGFKDCFTFAKRQGKSGSMYIAGLGIKTSAGDYVGWEERDVAWS